MSEQELREEVAALRVELAALREQIGSIGIRLGPRRETPAEEVERSARLAEVIARAAKAVSVDVPPVDRSALCTTSGEPPEKVRAEQTETTGQHKSYIVLCDAERAKGFVRPYRDAYKHVGPNICGLVVERGDTVCYMDPKHDGECGVASGPRPQACHSVTTMGRALSETYARDPAFYGATFCVSCNRHLPVAEFVWTLDGARVGS